MPRQYRRESRYEARVSFTLEPATLQAVRAAADKAGWSVAHTLRECVEAGLRTVRPRLRPSKRPQARPENAE